MAEQVSAAEDRGPEHLDVIIVGAGLSGIGQAWHLKTRCPDRRWTILEARDAIGGTWDLFRYPGIRSDSDMHTLGFSFHPWRGDQAIAEGDAIRGYIEETARTYAIDRQIRYNTRVTGAAWSTEDARWTVTAIGAAGEPFALTCGFLCLCAGYYDYGRGHMPDFPGADDFAGRVVHPQFWPDDLDHAGQRVVVIGSGATAVTLVPAMAKTASHVTMLQRSPAYVVSRPVRDRIADWLAAMLPARVAYGLTRWKNVLLGMIFYHLSRTRPARVKQRIIAMVRNQLGPDYDVATHFTPRYDPWDQRVCLVPDADLFEAIRAGRAEVVTDTIDRFTHGGIRLSSGRELPADIIVTATGLEIQLLGGMMLSIDGAPVDLSRTVQYKGMMFSGVPNLVAILGYTNASWTLKAELVAAYVCRLLRAMQRRGMRQATPRIDDPSMALEPIIDFSSGYVQRALDRLPKQGARKPWRLHQNYARDILALRFGSVEPGMTFSNPQPRPAIGARHKEQA